MKNPLNLLKTTALIMAAALFVALFFTQSLWRKSLDQNTNFYILRFLSVDFLFLFGALVFFILKKSGFARAFLIWAGVGPKQSDQLSKHKITDLYCWVAVGLPFLGAVAEHAIRQVVPDFTGPRNLSFWIYFFIYLCCVFLMLDSSNGTELGRT